MARSITRSAGTYIRQALGTLSLSAETSFETIRAAVARDESEREPIRRILAVMVKQKHAVITGEGDEATYRLTPSGDVLLTEMKAK